MSEKTLSQLIGNVKKEYTKEDFNPYDVMNYIYDNCLAGGPHSKIAVVGYSVRFQEEIVRAWHHVLKERNLIQGNLPPAPVDGRVTTHNGVIIQFVGMTDSDTNQQKYQRIMDDFTHVALCNKYVNPNLTSITRFYINTRTLYTFHNNNLKKDIDTQE